MANDTSGENSPVSKLPIEGDVYFCLLNRKFKCIVDSLRLSQVRAIATTIRAEDQADWMLWYEGQPQWVPIAPHMSELVIPRGEAKAELAASVNVISVDLPKVISSDTGASITFNREDLKTGSSAPQAQSTPAPEGHKPRATPRYAHEYEVMFDTRSKIVKAKTVDVSIMGLRIDKPFPEEPKAAMATIIKTSKGSVEVYCELIQGQKPEERRRFRILPSRNIERLRSILLEIEKERSGATV